MDRVLKRVSGGLSPASERFERAGVLQPPARGRGVPGPLPYPLFIAGMCVAALLFTASCGVKAPPRPRELVVPAPVEDVAVTVVPEGLKVTFTLPSKSLSGSPLKMIGGFRIVREGPDGSEVRKSVRLSVSDMRGRVGKRTSFLDDPPASAGTYRYCVIPVDAYGSHGPKSRIEASCWEGYLSAPGDPRKGSRPAPDTVRGE